MLKGKCDLRLSVRRGAVKVWGTREKDWGKAQFGQVRKCVFFTSSMM